MSTHSLSDKKLKPIGEECQDVVSTTAGTGPAAIGFNDLPVEVIHQIFAYLPYPDFQEIRLVCQLWYDIATQNFFLLNKEKTVLIRDCDQSKRQYEKHFIKPMMQSKREFFHLEFQGGTKYAENSEKHSQWWNDWHTLFDAKFWEHFGHKIRTLAVNWCEIEEQHFRRLLSCCINLQTLEIKNCCLTKFELGNWKGIDKTQLPKLENLESFIFEKEADPVPESHGLNETFFLEIVSCAPNLKSLAVNYCMGDPAILRPLIKHPLPVARVLQYLNDNPSNITEISFKHCRSDSSDDALLSLLTIPNLKLRSLTTNYPIQMELAGSLQSLEKLVRTDTLVGSNEIDIICSELPNLKHLEVEKAEVETCLNSILALSLTSLKLHFHDVILHVGDDFVIFVRPIIHDNIGGPNLEVSATLTALALTGGTMVKKYPLQKISMLTNLTHLTLSRNDNITDQSVQAIFKNLVHLQLLELLYCNNLTTEGLLGLKPPSHQAGQSDDEVTMYSIARLTKLRKLNLSGCDSISGRSFRELIFPELRHLLFSAALVNCNDLNSLFRNHARLETLEMQDIDLVSKIVNGIVENLPRLKYFYVGAGSRISKQNLVKLRRHCRALIFDNQLDSGSETSSDEEQLGCFIF